MALFRRRKTEEKRVFGGYLSFLKQDAQIGKSRGSTELLKGYGTMPWLRATVNKVSKSIASTPWKVYRPKGGTGVAEGFSKKLARMDFQQRHRTLAKAVKQQRVEELDSHPVLDLLDTGNEFMHGSAVRQITQIHLDLLDEAFWIKERDQTGQTMAVWPTPPTWVKTTPRPRNEAPTFLVELDGNETTIPARDMIWFREPAALDPYGRGTGTGRALADELDTDEFAARFLKQFFLNNARPDVLISSEGMSPTQTAVLEQRWDEKLRGLYRAHRPFFLSKKVDVHQLSQSLQSLQMVELRKHERDTIVQVYGVPPEILGILADSNRATIDAAAYLYARWVLVPRLELLRNILQLRLMPDFGSNLILDYESPVEEDRKLQIEAAKAAPWSLSVDEWRDLAGHEEHEDPEVGRTHLTQLNLTTLDSILSPSKEEPLEDEPVEPPELPDDDQAIIGGNGHDPYPAKIDEHDIDRVINALGVGIMLGAMQPGIRETILAFGQLLFSELGITDISFNVEDPAVLEYLKHKAAENIRHIDAYTKELIRQELLSGVASGEGIPGLAARIGDVFEDSRGARANMIARTETVRAANFGLMQGMKQTNVKMKEWLSSRDLRVRESHKLLDKTRVRVNAMFRSPVTGAQGLFPGEMGRADEDINCRCRVIAVFEDGDGEPRQPLDTEEKREASWKSFESEREPLERMVITLVQRAFTAQETAVLAALETPTAELAPAEEAGAAE
jgi:HK97 family phage portal protein